MKFHRYSWSIKYLYLLLFVPIIVASAQEANPKLRLAKSLERNHEYERALVFYQELYSNNKADIQVIQGIKSCYTGLQKYEDLIMFIKSVQQRFPARHSLHVDLGEAYYLNNQREKALDIWRFVLDNDKKNVAIYRQVASAMIRQRLYDEAVATYQLAINRLKNQFNLHIEIANLYKAQLAYDKAAFHYLAFYQKNPKQKQFIQREILRLTDQSEQISTVIDAITQFLEKYDAQSEIKEILAGLYIKEKQFENAFEIFKALETQKADGLYLQRFATEALRNNALSMAIEAFALIIREFPDRPICFEAQFQIANCRSLLAQQYRADGRGAEAAIEMEQARLLYEQIIEETPSSVFVQDSFIKLGDIALDFDFDLDKSEYYFSTYLKKANRGVTREKVLLKLAAVYVMKNDLTKANNVYKLIQHKKYRVQADFEQLELLYYRGLFRQTLFSLQNLLDNIGTKHTLANDILSRIKLIHSHIQDSLSLSMYAKAELLHFQRRQSEAVKLLIKLFSDQVPLSALSGALHDEILFKLAQCEEQIGNSGLALQNYQKLLIQFPNSLYNSEARERARILSKSVESEQL
jgi:thioredoxin-like negative regulator of GroEL